MRKALYILAQLDDSDVEWLAQYGTRRRLAEGEILVRQGEAIDSIFITLAGRFVVTFEGQEVAWLRAGEIVGEISFVDNEPPLATVAAIEPALVLAVPRASLQVRLDADDQFAARFYYALAIFLADRLRATIGRLEYSKAGDLESKEMLNNELDIGLLDTVSEAGQRFTLLLRALATA